ncbi:MAG: serine hydroxymethyltransferase, partial [Mycobacterium sp.]|nr:serine hydroxymethyltransferase [Mycobacterium sp.]
ATRGFGDAEFSEVGDIIATALAGGKNVDVPALRERVTRLTRSFPLYEGIEDWTLADRRGTAG